MSNPEQDPWFSEPELTPSRARNSLRSHSAVFARRVWVDWLITKDKTAVGEQGIVIEALKHALWLGGTVARGMHVDPQGACLVSLEVQSGQDYSYLQSMGEIADIFIAHNFHIVEDLEEVELDPGDPRENIAPFEFKASELIFKGTKGLHAMLDGGEQDMFALGDYLNAMIYTARLFDQHVGDDFNLHGPDEPLM